MSGRMKNMFGRIRGWRSPSTPDHPPAATPRPRRSIRDAITDAFGRDAFDKVHDSSTTMAFLLGAKPVYQGTVARTVVQRRRAANKRARRARAMHRRAAR